MLQLHYTSTIQLLTPTTPSLGVISQRWPGINLHNNVVKLYIEEVEPMCNLFVVSFRNYL